MKTIVYNPSQIEVNFAEAISQLSDEIEAKLDGIKIIEVENRIKADNPLILFHLQDTDGDIHELVIKLIQKPDKL